VVVSAELLMVQPWAASFAGAEVVQVCVVALFGDF
jgi:hypothetical protein